MPIHHNKDGTWQWGQAWKKYRSRKDAIRQMRTIFANGYKELQDKKASFLGASRASQFLAAVALVGFYGMVKNATDNTVLRRRYYSYSNLNRDMWNQILALNKARAWFNAVLTILSQRNPYAVSKDGGAYGLGQIRNIAFKAIQKNYPGWGAGKKAADLIGDVPLSRDAILKYTDIANRKVTRLRSLAISILKHPQRSYYRYTRGPYAFYNKYIKTKSLPKGWTLQLLAEKDPRVQSFMNYYKTLLDNMPKKPVILPRAARLEDIKINPLPLHSIKTRMTK